MPQPIKPPRLWLARTGIWLILDRGRQTSTGERDRVQAEVALAQYVAKRFRRNGPQSAAPVADVLRKALSRAKDRARAKGISITIAESDLLNLYNLRGGHCAVTGIPFRVTHTGKSRCNPYGISIDRIDPRNGYDLDNVRLVLTAVNTALSDFGEGVFREIVAAMMRHGISANHCSNVETVTDAAELRPRLMEVK